MFALPLSDPLWRKLDDAHRDRDIPDVLRRLSEQWDEATARSLFWDCLCHQDTCYGATYASAPHLLRVAASPPSPEAVQEIAFFLGHVAMVAFWPVDCCGREGREDRSTPQGLPLDLEAWDRKLDPYRSLAEHARKDLADPDFPENLFASFDNNFQDLIDKLAEPREFAKAVGADHLGADHPAVEMKGGGPWLSREARQADLERYAEILSRPPVNEGDLAVIVRIRDAFFEAQAAIAELCAEAYESAGDPDERGVLLSGVAAALGDQDLAQLFNHGDQGCFCCANCGWDYEYATYGERIACYAAPVGPGESYARAPGDNPLFLDYKDGAPNRADGFVRPCAALDMNDPAAARIYGLASAADLSRLKRFKGAFPCQRCGAVTPLQTCVADRRGE